MLTVMITPLQTSQMVTCTEALPAGQCWPMGWAANCPLTTPSTRASGGGASGRVKGRSTTNTPDNQSMSVISRGRKWCLGEDNSSLAVDVARDVKWGQGILYYPSGKYFFYNFLQFTVFLDREVDVQWGDET